MCPSDLRIIYQHGLQIHLGFTIKSQSSIFIRVRAIWNYDLRFGLPCKTSSYSSILERWRQIKWIPRRYVNVKLTFKFYKESSSPQVVWNVKNNSFSCFALWFKTKNSWHQFPKDEHVHKSFWCSWKTYLFRCWFVQSQK